MEDKTIKVRCINKECTNLTFKKEYEAIKKWKEESKMKPNNSFGMYLVVDDSRNESVETCCLFEEVKEDILIVECIDNESQEKFLTLNKKYEILEENNRGYFIIDDTKTKYLAHKSRFKPVPKEKEQLEHAQDKELKCYNKKCNHNKENKCNISSVTENCGCKERLKEPINYEEEYNKLKSENERLNKGIELKNSTIKHLESVLKIKDSVIIKDIETVEKLNKIIESQNEQIERLGKSTNEYYYNWIEAQKEAETATKLLSNFRHMEAGQQEKLKEKVESLKDIIIRLTELL